ncbi:hypothetical protein JR334_06670 [Clostridia bacterium]|nr:hypothetical protein JR334_06670 [Clostridia bacterium]
MLEIDKTKNKDYCKCCYTNKEFTFIVQWKKLIELVPQI